MVSTLKPVILLSASKRHLRLGHVVAPVGVRHERLGAVRGPLHRPANALGGDAAGDLLGVDVDLGAEAAADVRRDDAQLVLGRDVVERAHDETRDVRVLAGGVERGVVLGARCSRAIAERGSMAEGTRRLLRMSISTTWAAFAKAASVAASSPSSQSQIRLSSAVPGWTHGAVGVVGEVRQRRPARRSRPRPPRPHRLASVARLGDHHRDRLADIAHRLRVHHRCTAPSSWASRPWQ